MHELSVTQSLLDVVLEAAEQAGGVRIQAIDLVVGDFSSIVDESVQFYFDMLSRGTLAEAAELRFRREQASAQCHECGKEFAVVVPLMPLCPYCESSRLYITGGRAFYVDSIEVEDEDSHSERDPECQ